MTETRQAAVDGSTGAAASSGDCRPHIQHHAASDPADLLRRLAASAVGLSGADIERLVREARSKVRREGRSLRLADLETMLAGQRPTVSAELRRRTAIHEAGHAVVRHVLGIGRVTCVTIATTGSSGGYVEAEEDLVDVETEARLMGRLAIWLAGRAAERVILGSISAGAGGGDGSDLAQATRLAVAMETAFGFGKSLPLLHQPIEQATLLGSPIPGLARRAHRRMRRAERAAARLVAGNRRAVTDLAASLLEAETLQGEELRAVLPAAHHS